MFDASRLTVARILLIALVQLLFAMSTVVHDLTQAGVIALCPGHALFRTFAITRIRRTRVGVGAAMLVFGAGNIARIFRKTKQTHVFDARGTINRIFDKDAGCLRQRQGQRQCKYNGHEQAGKERDQRKRGAHSIGALAWALVP